MDEVLKGQRFISINTYKKNGHMIATPVVFAYTDQKIVIMTGAHSGKIKRLKNNPQATISPCNSRGEIKGVSINTKARFIAENETKWAYQAMLKKNGLIFRLYRLYGQIKNWKFTFIEFSPVEQV